MSPGSPWPALAALGGFATIVAFAVAYGARGIKEATEHLVHDELPWPGYLIEVWEGEFFIEGLGVFAKYHWILKKDDEGEWKEFGDRTKTQGHADHLDSAIHEAKEALKEYLTEGVFD